MIDEKKLIERLWEQHKGIKANAECYTDAEEVADEICNVVSIIDEQPKIDEWIPVSERLPNKDMTCLTTVYDKSTGRRLLKHREFRCGSFIQAGASRAFPVIAWMPLPEPYKERGEADD